MNYRQALDILGVKPSMSIDSITKRYKELLIKSHPDHGGNLQWFQDVREAYKTVLKHYKYEKYEYDEKSKERTQKTVNLEPELQEKILQIFTNINTDFIDIEITGNWLWLAGETYSQRELIKDLGFRFSKNKVRWYWHPEGYEKKSRGTSTMEKIREMHGSMNVESNRPKLLKAGK